MCPADRLEGRAVGEPPVEVVLPTRLPAFQLCVQQVMILAEKVLSGSLFSQGQKS